MGGIQGREWKGWLSQCTASTFIRCCYLQYVDYLSLRDNELVIVGTVVPVYASRNQRDIKVDSVLTRSPQP